MKMKTVVIHGCYNNRNFGDILMLDMLTARVRSELGVRVLSPWVTRLSDGRSSRADIFGASLLKADVGLFGGGGYLQDGANGLARYACAGTLWKWRGVPYAISGVGVGPSLTGLSERRAVELCNVADYVDVRDSTSAELLIRSGVARSKVTSFADSVMQLTRCLIPDYAVQIAAKQLPPRRAGKLRIGLHIPDYVGRRDVGLLPPYIGRRCHDFARRVVSAVDNVIRKHKSIQIVWLEYGQGVSTWNALRHAGGEAIPGAVCVPQCDHWVSASVISDLDAVLTTRLHVGVAACAMGVPCASVASHDKTVRFFEQIGRGQFCVREACADRAFAGWIETIAEDYGSFATWDNHKIDEVRRHAGEMQSRALQWLANCLR